MNTIKECFEIILQGKKEESRLAARQVRKLVYSSSADYKERQMEIKKIINTAPDQYADISEDWRQENFVVAVSVIYFLHDREKQPDFLFPWLLELLLHQNGNIRQSAVRMLCHEIGPLTVHIRIPDQESHFGLKTQKADVILLTLYASLQELLSFLWQPKYKRYKYIDSLPASPYKSVQMVLAKLSEDCGENYFDEYIKYLASQADEVFFYAL